MKTTKNLIALAIALSSNLAFGQELVSIELFNALSNAGATLETSTGSTYVGVEDLWCYKENSYSRYTCEMIDTGVEGEGKKISVSGELADAILDAIPGDGPFDPWGRFEFSIGSITCKTATEDLIDIHVGEVATCTFVSTAE